jgi:hypothetical protein
MIFEKDPYLKKNPNKGMKFSSSDQFYAEVEGLIDLCNNIVTSELSAIEAFGGLNTSKLKEIKKEFIDHSEKLRSYKDEWEKYPWNDPSVQGDLSIIGDKIKDLQEQFAKAKQFALGKDEAYRIANKYFETAEDLRKRATEKILSMASMRSKEIEADRQRANTDITRTNELDNDKIDIVAKKENIPDNESSEDKSNRESRDKKREIEAKRVKAGMFYYLSTILGETQNEFKSKWNPDFDIKSKADFSNDKEFDDWKKKKVKGADGSEKTNEEWSKLIRGYRNDLLKLAIPFMEKITGRDYNEKDPFSDKQYISDLMVLGSYTPGYKNYKPEKQAPTQNPSEEEKNSIKAEVDKIKKTIQEKISTIENNNSGNGLKESKIREELGKAKKDLDLVDSSSACDIESFKSLSKGKRDLEGKIKTYKRILDPEKDVKPMEEILKKIEEILDYCESQEYKIK